MGVFEFEVEVLVFTATEFEKVCFASTVRDLSFFDRHFDIRVVRVSGSDRETGEMFEGIFDSC